MTEKALNVVPARGVIADMAARYGMNEEAFERTLRATVVPPDTSKEQFAAFLLVAKEYNLNPVIKQIYAFPTKGGGIQPIVSIDGWLRMATQHPQFDGMEFEDRVDDGKLVAVTCRMYRKDRSRPVEVTEYMSECKRDTDTWKRWPARMLRHKATIQCARYCFGFSGIVDPDEAERMTEFTVEPVPARSPMRASIQRKSEREALEDNPSSETADALAQLLLELQGADSDERIDYLGTLAREQLSESGLAAFNAAASNRMKHLAEEA